VLLRRTRDSRCPGRAGLRSRNLRSSVINASRTGHGSTPSGGLGRTGRPANGSRRARGAPTAGLSRSSTSSVSDWATGCRRATACTGSVSVERHHRARTSGWIDGSPCCVGCAPRCALHSIRKRRPSPGASVGAFHGQRPWFTWADAPLWIEHRGCLHALVSRMAL
jgi:hypothetical protein